MAVWTRAEINCAADGGRATVVAPLRPFARAAAVFACRAHKMLLPNFKARDEILHSSRASEILSVVFIENRVERLRASGRRVDASLPIFVTGTGNFQRVLSGFDRKR